MEQNKLFKSDSQKWDQSEESKKFSDSIVGSFNTSTKQRLSDSESLNISGEQIQVNTAMSNVMSKIQHQEKFNLDPECVEAPQNCQSELNQTGKMSDQWTKALMNRSRNEKLRSDRASPYWGQSTTRQQLPKKESQSYPTTSAVVEDLTKTGVMLLDKEQSKLIPQVTSSIKENNEISRSRTFNPTTNLSEGNYTAEYQSSIP